MLEAMRIYVKHEHYFTRAIRYRVLNDVRGERGSKGSAFANSGS